MTLTIDLSAMLPPPKIKPWPGPVMKSGWATCPLCGYCSTVLHGTEHCCSRNDIVYFVHWKWNGTAQALQMTPLGGHHA